MGISELWVEYAEYVLRVCKHFVKSPAMAEDVRGEVFLKILNSTEAFKDKSDVKTWLYSIAYRCCVDYFRIRKKQRQIEDEWILQGNLFLRDSISPVWEVSSASGMPCPISQLFVELVFDEGWTTDEIAAVFGFSKGYVNKKIQEGINQLQKFLH
jgi:DNA-directed RNA polymerase specialized sigma24 family protein